MECCRPVVNGCPSSTPAQNTWNSWDQDPHNAYNNAYYHYQAYTYYWDLYNSHFSQGRYNSSHCECYDYAGQGTADSTWYPMALSSSRCVHCPEEGHSQFTGHLKPNEAQAHFHEESYDMDVEEQTYEDIDDAGDHEEDDDDDDEHNFELDEKFCQFLRQSEKHRQEREKGRKLIQNLNPIMRFIHLIEFSL